MRAPEAPIGCPIAVAPPWMLTLSWGMPRSCVTMFAMQDLGIPHDKVNIHGGATAMGHPIGASGARILATLIAALQRTGGKRGIAALCIGGGEATAMAVELVD